MPSPSPSGEPHDDSGDSSRWERDRRRRRAQQEGWSGEREDGQREERGEESFAVKMHRGSHDCPCGTRPPRGTVKSTGQCELSCTRWDTWLSILARPIPVRSRSWLLNDCSHHQPPASPAFALSPLGMSWGPMHIFAVVLYAGRLQTITCGVLGTQTPCCRLLSQPRQPGARTTAGRPAVGCGGGSSQSGGGGGGRAVLAAALSPPAEPIRAGRGRGEIMIFCCWLHVA